MAAADLRSESEEPSPGGAAALSDDQLEALAQRIARILERIVWMLATEHHSGHARLLSADEVAERYGVSRSWVYEHAQELGALKLGRHRNGRVRFDRAVVERNLERIGPPEIGSQRRRVRQPAAAAADGELLRIRGRP